MIPIRNNLTFDTTKKQPFIAMNNNKPDTVKHIIRKSLLKLVVILAFFAATTAKTHAQFYRAIDEKDSLALVDLYKSTDGDNWLNNSGWLRSPVSRWHGVMIFNKRVITLMLAGNWLKGTIPASIGDLTELNILLLGSNKLNGTIPETIGNLTKLTSLNLSFNQLTGPIPSSIGDMYGLTSIYLGHNKLSGTIPSTIGELSDLAVLLLDHNQLEGTLPKSLFRLRHLMSMNLSYNNIDDILSEDIGKMKNLSTLRLSANKFHGEIPTSLNDLPRLKTCSLDSNQLTGAMPTLKNVGTTKTTTTTTYSTDNQDYPSRSTHVTQKKSDFYSRLQLQKLGEKTLTVSVGLNPAHYTFIWFKDGVPIATFNGDTTYTPTEDGKYSVSITNSDDPTAAYFGGNAIKKGDSLILETQTAFNSSSKHTSLPKSLTDKLDRASMVFNPSMLLSEMNVKENDQVKYDYALMGKGKEDSGLEVRYIVQPMDTYLKMKEDKNRVMIDPNKPVLYKGYLMTMVMNIAGGSVPINIKDMDLALVRKSFNADWGGMVMVDTKGTFGEGYKYCFIVAIHKDNVGEAYYLYMIQNKESLLPIMKETLGSLKFK